VTGGRRSDYVGLLEPIYMNSEIKKERRTKAEHVLYIAACAILSFIIHLIVNNL